MMERFALHFFLFFLLKIILEHYVLISLSVELAVCDEEV